MTKEGVGLGDEKALVEVELKDSYGMTKGVAERSYGSIWDRPSMVIAL